MSFRAKAKKYKKDLQSRHEESIENQEESGFVDYETIFLKEEIPEGIEFWKPGYGEHLIDIIPFFSGDNNPRVASGRLSYVIDLWVHQRIGVSGDSFVCQKDNFKKRDPICDYIRKTRPPTEEFKKIAPKRRTVYLVWVHDTPEEEEKGLQIWECAWWFFEKTLDKISKNPKGGAPIIFSDPDKGKLIAFEIEKSGTYTDSSGTDRDSQDWGGHRLIDREELIPDEILNTSFPLDDIIDMHPDSKKVKNSFYEGEEEEVEKVKTEEELEEEDEAQAEEEEETEPEETEPEETETDNSPEEEAPANTGTEECPAGATFGADCDKYENCDGCDLYDDCSDENQRLEKEKKEKKEAKKKPVAKKRRIVKRGRKK